MSWRQKITCLAMMSINLIHEQEPVWSHYDQAWFRISSFNHFTIRLIQQNWLSHIAQLVLCYICSFSTGSFVILGCHLYTYLKIQTGVFVRWQTNFWWWICKWYLAQVVKYSSISSWFGFLYILLILKEPVFHLSISLLSSKVLFLHRLFLLIWTQFTYFFKV